MVLYVRRVCQKGLKVSSAKGAEAKAILWDTRMPKDKVYDKVLVCWDAFET